MSNADPAEIYRQEATELLEQLEQALLDLERNPADADLVNMAFRALHTIKGSGAMFGFDRVAAFTHHVETAFDLVRKGKVSATGELIALTLAAKDEIRRLIEHPEVTDDTESEAILDGLRAIVGGATDPAVAPPPATPHAETPATWNIAFSLPRDAMILGTSPLLLLDDLRVLGPCTVMADTSGIPPFEELDPTECHLRWRVTLSTVHPRSAIEEVFLFVRDGMQLAIELVERIKAVDGGAASNSAPLAGAAPTAAAPQHAAETHPGADGTSIRVPAERLDELMDRVGELVIAQSRLKQIAAASSDASIKSVAEDIERLALELRDATMGARMVPIGQLFGRFRRLIHDLARDLGKDMAIVFVGEETELDKTLIERLADPLIHLIRNSADHGVESPAQRIEAGKPQQGHITLAARHLGHEVLISIADDGRGLDCARIQERAEEQGLLPQGAKPSEAELFQLLFQPGFSTMREVSSVSGRGVGMDVVRRAIEALRGSITITSRLGRGTEITLHLPLTLAIIDGLLVRVGEGKYVIPLSAIAECVELSTADDARSHGHSFLNIRGSLVPFVRLRELFGVRTPADPYQKVVVVASGEQRVGLVVDQVIGDHQTVIKSLSKLHADVETFSGATILGDGSVALILEVAHLVGHGQQRAEVRAAAE
jgi:two-component system, chemotaxis family, sensor kinase CheA